MFTTNFSVNLGRQQQPLQQTPQQTIISEILQFARVPLISNADCKQLYIGEKIFLSENLLKLFCTWDQC